MVSVLQVPFGSIVVLLLIWMFISLPLCLFGTVIGRNWAGVPNNPCRSAVVAKLSCADGCALNR